MNKYFIYNDKIYYGRVHEVKKNKEGVEVYTFHKPKSTALYDDVNIFSLFVADDVETLKNNIVNWARSLNYMKAQTTA